MGGVESLSKVGFIEVYPSVFQLMFSLMKNMKKQTKTKQNKQTKTSDYNL